MLIEVHWDVNLAEREPEKNSKNQHDAFKDGLKITLKMYIE